MEPSTLEYREVTLGSVVVTKHTIMKLGKLSEAIVPGQAIPIPQGIMQSSQPQAQPQASQVQAQQPQAQTPQLAYMWSPLENRTTRREVLSNLVDLDKYIHEIDKAVKARRLYWVQDAFNHINEPLGKLQNQMVQLNQMATSGPAQGDVEQKRGLSERDWLNTAKQYVAKIPTNRKAEIARKAAQNYSLLGGKRSAEDIFNFLMQ